MTHMVPDPVAARSSLRSAVDQMLTGLRTSGAPATETALVDLKEEAGRRDRSGTLLPGSATNPAAAEHLAGEVRCFTNTPGGGAIVLGVDDKTLLPLGTALDPEWLRQRIHDLTGVAPVIEEHDVRGIRVLALLVAESPEPVEDPDHRLRWRVGDRCVTVDRAEWWSHRAAQIGVDPLAAPSTTTPADITPRTLATVRDYLRLGDDADVADGTDEQLLVRLGVLRPDGYLSRAGALVLCPAPRPLVELSRLDVAGGDVTLRYVHPDRSSLLDALAEIETRIDAINAVRPTSNGLTEGAHRLLPARAVREAILNGLTHRDWFDTEPTTVRWIEADETLEVTSPGSFTGGVTSQNALTTRHARYPALADLFRALRLVDRQGVGVPRMYQTMLAEGHRTPVLEEIAGPRVRTTLPGRPPVPVLPTMLASIEPAPRRRDVRVAVLLDALLRTPFLTTDQVAGVLQCSPAAAAVALNAVAECRIDGAEIFAPFSGGWRISRPVVERAEAGAFGAKPPQSELLWFRVSGATTIRRVAELWLQVHDRVTSGDVAAVVGTHQPYVSAVLSALAQDEDVVARGPGKGRAAHFIAIS